MRELPCLAACLALTLQASAVDAVRIRLDSVPAEYTPNEGARVAERVSVESYAFEVNPETRRARVAIRYTSHDRQTNGMENGPGPRPTYAQIPSLVYDEASRAVVYIENGRRTVCATVPGARPARRGAAKPTGACSVASQMAEYSEDDGWRIRRVWRLDTYLVVR